MIVSRKKRIYGSGLSYPIYWNDHFLCGLDNGESIILRSMNPREEGVLTLEAYGDQYKIPIFFYNESTLMIDVEIGHNGYPQVIINNTERII